MFAQLNQSQSATNTVIIMLKTWNYDNNYNYDM